MSSGDCDPTCAPFAGVSGLPPGAHVVYAECLQNGTPHYETKWVLDDASLRDVLVLDLPGLPPGYFTLGILLLRGGNPHESQTETGPMDSDLLAMRKVTIEVLESAANPISDEVDSPSKVIPGSVHIAAQLTS